MNDGIETMIRHCLQQFIPNGWHISSIIEQPIEGKVAPRFLHSRLTEHGWEVCSTKVLATFQVQSRPKLPSASGEGSYRLCLLENGKMWIAESMLRLPSPPPGSATLSIGAIATNTPEDARVSWVTPGYERDDPSYDEKHLSWSMIGDEIEQEPERYTLRQWRIKAHMSRTELADMAGIDYKMMTRAELVQRPIDRAIAEKILTALRARFKQHPEYVKWERVPERVEEIEGLQVKKGSYE